jgi:hypothetical protein
MRLCLIICASCCLLTTGCDWLTQRETVVVRPHVPASLRQPVTVPARRIDTTNDLAAGYLEARSGLATANGRISAVDCLLTAAEQDADPDCGAAP